MDGLREIQEEYDKHTQETKVLNYEEVVLPYIKKAIAYLDSIGLKKWPVTNRIINGLDIYSEAITTMYISEYLKGNSLPLTVNMFVTMLIKHPYLINIVMCNRTSAEITKLKKDIFDELKTSYSTMRATSEYTTLIELVTDQKIKPTTSLDYYHYMLGFKYNSEFVSVKKDRLPKDTDGCYYVIHLSYGVTNTDSIVIYNSVPRLKEKLIYYDNIDKLNPFEYPKIYKYKTRNELLGINFKPISKPKTNAYVLLCYDNAPKTSDCTFSLACLDKEKLFLNPSEVNVLDKGGYFPVITEDDISLYINLNFILETHKVKLPKDELMEKHRTIMRILQAGIAALPSIKGFIETIMKHPSLKDVIHKNEIPYFRLYLSAMEDTLRKVTNPMAYQNYVLGYFYSDNNGLGLFDQVI